MSRSSRLKEVGSVICNDLSEVSSGKEGWLHDPSILTAFTSTYLALANRTTVLILSFRDSSFKTTIRSLPFQCEISAIEWLDFEFFCFLALGTSNGHLLIYSLEAQLVHKQMIYPEHILRIKANRVKSFLQESPPEEICIVMNGIIARVDAFDVQNLLQSWSQRSHSLLQRNKLDHGDTEKTRNAYAHLSFQLWNITKYGSVSDAAITGLMPPPLLEIQSSKCYYCAVATGTDAVFSAFRLSDDRSRSLLGAVLSRVVPASFSAISSLSRFLWKNAKATTKQDPPPAFSKASPLTCLKDNRRKGEKLTVSPGGSLAAISDSLGRVILLDTHALVAVRLWKGYREACCLFFELIAGRDDALTHNVGSCGQSDNDYYLCLAIHAPRKGVVEVWKMRNGPRLFTIQCSMGCKIMQPSYRFTHLSPVTPYVPLDIFILDGESGRVSLVSNSFS